MSIGNETKSLDLPSGLFYVGQLHPIGQAFLSAHRPGNIKAIGKKFARKERKAKCPNPFIDVLL